MLPQRAQTNRLQGLVLMSKVASDRNTLKHVSLYFRTFDMFVTLGFFFGFSFSFSVEFVEIVTDRL
jgi:hypothetical protein